MKTILITGASSGLGLALARVYTKDYHIILVARSEDKLKACQKLLEGPTSIFTCDIRSNSDISDLKAYLIREHGSISCLINNAGVGYFGPFLDLKAQEIQDMVQTNTTGTILLTHTLLPLVDDKVMTIISTAGLKPKVNESVYVASKYALRGFMESLQLEYQGQKKFLPIYMGGMDTAFWDHSDHIKDKSRLKSPDLVARTIRELDDGRKEIIL